MGSGRVPKGGAGAPERDGYGYPLFRKNDRVLPRDWTGALYVWDIDNTYLVTEWSGLRDLIRIRFEAAEDKRPVPGAVELLAAVRRGSDPDRRPPVFFVSASPETMRPTLERRMLIDGVAHDGVTFRDLGKLRYLRDIFGYKIAALLLYRLENPPLARESLFGDDREHDPEIYALYARICAGAVRGKELREYLEARDVRRSASRYIETLASELPERDPVEWIFIRRVVPGKPKTPLRLEDDRIVLVEDYAQTAAVLRALGRIDHEDLLRIVAAVHAAGLGRKAAEILELPRVQAATTPELIQATRLELERATPAEVAAAGERAASAALVPKAQVEAAAEVAQEAEAHVRPEKTKEETS